MKSVKDILERKGREVFSVDADETVFEALSLMADKNIGAVLVYEKGEVAGIMSERDYARKVILKGKASKETPVREIMSTRILCVTPEQTAEDCLALITDKHLRHLPVIENEQLIGILSIGDIVKAIIDEKAYLIEQMERYIQGRH